MRQLTFAGYLKSYAPSLAGTSSKAMSRLADRALERPRVVEPLLLMAVVTDRADELARQLKDRPKLLGELQLLGEFAESGQLETALASEDPRLRPEYAKAWRSYVAKRDAPHRDTRLKEVARSRALEMEAAKRVTRYRMAKDLGLNPGNLHAFLSQGNVSKMSLKRAYELVDYLEAA
jgi:hypothetical protein